MPSAKIMAFEKPKELPIFRREVTWCDHCTVLIEADYSDHTPYIECPNCGEMTNTPDMRINTYSNFN